jgi:DNA-binding winged helix-turn-helix (wHTH) protein/TolB-like protein
MKSSRVYAFGEFRLDVSRRRLLRAGQAVALSSKLFDTLLYLVERPGVVLSRHELLDALWPDVVVEENNLGQAISKLRGVLGEAPGDNHYIVTVPGRGYRFVAEVAALDDAAADERPPAAASSDPSSPPGEPVQLSEGRSSRPAPALRTLTALGMALAVLGLAGLALWSLSGVPRTNPDPTRSLAVLPFKALVPEGGDDVLQFGMADSLIMKLSHVQSLTVRPLAAVRGFNDAGQDPFAAGRELGVDAVLDGHVHRTADRVRVTTRLVRIADGRQLWAAQYDEPLSDIFDIQDAISERVASELALHLSADERQRIARPTTASPVAYEAYLKGRFFLSLAQPRQAVETFEEAIRLDPTFALAYAGLADTLSRLPIATDGPSHDAMRRARAAADKALDLDRDLADAHAVRGWIAFYYDWDWPASERAYRDALALSQQNFSARLGYAHLLSNTGRGDEALEQVALALGADPLSPLARALESQFLFHAGREAEAREKVQRVLESSPGFWIAHVLLGRILLEERRYEEAAAAFAHAATGGGTWTPRALTAYTHAVSGRRDEALGGLARMMADEGPAPPPYLVALVHLGLGDREQALGWLERGFEARDVRMVFLGVDPVWDPLRGDTRFISLVRRMSLPESRAAVRLTTSR